VLDLLSLRAIFLVVYDKYGIIIFLQLVLLSCSSQLVLLVGLLRSDVDNLLVDFFLLLFFLHSAIFIFLALVVHFIFVLLSIWRFLVFLISVVVNIIIIDIDSSDEPAYIFVVRKCVPLVGLRSLHDNLLNFFVHKIILKIGISY
jgi:hypothetical protein